MILRREMASVAFDFDHRKCNWIKRADSIHAEFNPGYKSYCLRQARLWEHLCADAYSRVKNILPVCVFIPVLWDIF